MCEPCVGVGVCMCMCLCGGMGGGGGGHEGGCLFSLVKNKFIL